MTTKLITQTFKNNIISTKNPSAVKQASDFILSGEIIAVPTDTVYGLCCNARNTSAVQKLFDVKARTFNKPISLCFSTIKHIETWADVSYIPRDLINRLLPGPVTLVLRSKLIVHGFISTKSDLSGRLVVGVRIPNNEFINSLCDRLEHPIALTSANVSGNRDSICVEEFKELWPHLAGVFDRGTLNKRAPSTVVDLSEPNKYKILREGAGLEFVKANLMNYRFESVNS